MTSFNSISSLRYLSTLVFISIFVAAPTVAKAQTKSNAIDSFESNDAVEKRIKGMISENLDLFLNKKDYRIFATAKIIKFREKIVLDGESESKTTGEENSATELVRLPGFKNNDMQKESAKNVNRNERSRFSYKNRTKLSMLSVRLVLESQLPQNAKDLAIKTSKEAIDLVAGKVGSFEAVELDLTAPREANGVWEWFASHLSKKGGPAIDLLYLSLLLLAFLGALFALHHYFKGKKNIKGNATSGTQANSFADQKEIDDLCGEKMDELIGLLNSSPLITRNFLQNLGPDDKNFLYRSLKTPSLQGYFRKVLRVNQPEGYDRNRQDSAQVFETILKDLKRFIQLNNEMVCKPFGYVPVMTGTQIAQFIVTEKGKIKTLSVIAPYLADHQVGEVTRMLSVTEKAEFIGHMRDKNGEIALDNAQSLAEMAKAKGEVDSRLRLRYLSIREEAVVDVAETQSLEIAFLESDSECVDVIKSLAAKYGKIPHTYEKYLVGFEDFLGLDLGIAKRVMQRVSNDVLIAALADRDIDERLVSMLGDMRSQLIKSLMKRESSLSKIEIEAAKNEVLKLYRTTV